MNAHTSALPTWAAAHALERARLANLRARIARQIEADLDRVDRCLRILDALTPDPDIEEGGDTEPSLGSLGGSQLWWSRGGLDDREDGDDTGIGDVGGLAEQRGRYLIRGGLSA
ncbi:hypothetical protein Q8W71_07365 [Methylobacterium sp. NEAU 140]|uniref:hypothetical protein n=1 Tax=Methylobacterium sp. NEAU 140 TaxID=3064945 RepID=UPI0027336226|nr:hypothetical protein [Methylobacterium sp. NEAU 140]MDP4022436.1 hypothetical protein [Methylobacterium sp. NEAU 140]